MPTNQGRDIDLVFEEISTEDLDAVAEVIWLECSRHPGEASCFCPAVEAVAKIQELGYRLVRND